MKTKIIFVLLTVLFVFMSVAYTHSGRTDSNGGHYNRQTGTYHYHHGYSAHDHEDGICPYDFDDKTNHSSGSNSVKDSGYITNPIPTATPAPTEIILSPPTEKENAPLSDNFFLIQCCLFIVCTVKFTKIIIHNNNNEKVIKLKHLFDKLTDKIISVALFVFKWVIIIVYAAFEWICAFILWGIMIAAFISLLIHLFNT